jgi:hypothetical protein
LKLTTCARADLSAPGFLLSEDPQPETSMPIPSRSSGGKPVTRALIAALEESAPGANAPNLRRIVDNLIGKAIDGDLSAIREIFDRIEGKAATAGTATEEPTKVVFEWKSNE